MFNINTRIKKIIPALLLTTALPVLAESENVVNLGIDKSFNFQISDMYGNKPQRCVKPDVEGKTVTTAELAANNEAICRIYQKPTDMLDSKSFNVMLHKGSYILTIIDDNGMIFQICYDDYWRTMDCGKL